MSNYDVLIADDQYVHRLITEEAVKNSKGEEQPIFKACNPPQADFYFEANRNKAKNLLVISDVDMSGVDYKKTNLPEPDYATIDFARNSFNHLVTSLRSWSKETGNNYFLVRRSSGDKVSSSKEDLENSTVNNCETPYILSKYDEDQQGQISNILKHCDKLFSVSA